MTTTQTACCVRPDPGCTSRACTRRAPSPRFCAPCNAMRLVLILTFLPCLLASSVRSAEADEAHMMARALAVDDEYSYSYEYIVAVNTPAPSPAPTSSPAVLAVTLTVDMDCDDYGADEAAAFAAALEATISGATVDASEEDCTQLSRRRSLLQSTSAELDFTVTVSGSDAATATAASIESVVDAAISSGDFDTALDSAGLTLDVTVSGVSAVLPVPTAVPTPSPVAGKKKSKDKDDVNTALENPVAIVMLVIVLLLCFVAVMKYQPKKDEDDGKVKNPPYNVQDDIVAEDHPSMIEVLPEDRAYALGEIMEG